MYNCVQGQDLHVMGSWDSYETNCSNKMTNVTSSIQHSALLQPYVTLSTVHVLNLQHYAPVP